MYFYQNITYIEYQTTSDIPLLSTPNEIIFASCAEEFSSHFLTDIASYEDHILKKHHPIVSGWLLDTASLTKTLTNQIYVKNGNTKFCVFISSIFCTCAEYCYKNFFFKVKSGEVKTCVKFLISLLEIRM